MDIRNWSFVCSRGIVGREAERIATTFRTSDPSLTNLNAADLACACSDLSGRLVSGHFRTDWSFDDDCFEVSITHAKLPDASYSFTIMEDDSIESDEDDGAAFCSAIADAAGITENDAAAALAQCIEAAVEECSEGRKLIWCPAESPSAPVDIGDLHCLSLTDLAESFNDSEHGERVAAELLRLSALPDSHWIRVDFRKDGTAVFKAYGDDRRHGQELSRICP